MPALELFTGTHDGEIVRTFLNACETYFKLTGILDENTKALLPKLACQTLHVLGMMVKAIIRQWLHLQL